MATEQASATTSEPALLAKWSSWLAALVGLWVFVSPFVLTGPIASGTAMWSALLSGIAILVLGAFGAYELRTSVEPGANTPAEWSGWITALTGIWLGISPFVLTGAIGTGSAMWSTVIAGAIAAITAAYAGYGAHTRR